MHIAQIDLHQKTVLSMELTAGSSVSVIPSMALYMAMGQDDIKGFEIAGKSLVINLENGETYHLRGFFLEDRSQKIFLQDSVLDMKSILAEEAHEGTITSPFASAIQTVAETASGLTFLGQPSLGLEQGDAYIYGFHVDNPETSPLDIRVMVNNEPKPDWLTLNDLGDGHFIIWGTPASSAPATLLFTLDIQNNQTQESLMTQKFPVAVNPPIESDFEVDTMLLRGDVDGTEIPNSNILNSMNKTNAASSGIWGMASIVAVLGTEYPLEANASQAYIAEPYSGNIENITSAIAATQPTIQLEPQVINPEMVITSAAIVTNTDRTGINTNTNEAGPTETHTFTQAYAPNQDVAISGAITIDTTTDVPVDTIFTPTAETPEDVIDITPTADTPEDTTNLTPTAETPGNIIQTEILFTAPTPENQPIILETAVPTSPSLQPLFTFSNDNVDFNTLASSTYDPNTFYNVLGGNNTVILPDQLNAIRLSYDSSQTFNGQGGVDNITGRDLNDIINGGGGTDSISAGLGNDLIHLDTNDLLVDGGPGTDMLFFSDPTSLIIDFTQPNQISNFELIHLDDSGSTITLDGPTIDALSSLSTTVTVSSGGGTDTDYLADVMIVQGDSSNTLNLTADPGFGWLDQNSLNYTAPSLSQVVDGQVNSQFIEQSALFNTYVYVDFNNAEAVNSIVYVQQDISVVV